MSRTFVVSVSTLLTRIKNILLETVNLNQVWIQGEVSNLTKHRSGHYYFSLKDATGEIHCVMFASYVNHLDFKLEEGMQVLVSGSVNIYEARGSLQLYVKQMKPDGLGALYLELEKRKKRLFDAGFFSDSHKKAKPEWIENIAVVTAKEGAAIQDVCKTIQNRWPQMKITLYPSLVQGTNAPQSIIQSLLLADQKGYDAILLVRGGGSFEDLFCFNDEALVKTIYNLQTYIVTGVGHEVDTTLVDFVADHHELTPTAAAQWISLDQYEVMAALKNYQAQMTMKMESILKVNQVHLHRIQSNPYLLDPLNWTIEKQMRLDASEQNLIHSMQLYTDKMRQNFLQIQSQLDPNMILNPIRMQQHALELSEANLKNNIEKLYQSNKQNFLKSVSLLDAFSPLKTVSRGYAIVRLQFPSTPPTRISPSSSGRVPSTVPTPCMRKISRIPTPPTLTSLSMAAPSMASSTPRTPPSSPRAATLPKSPQLNTWWTATALRRPLRAATLWTRLLLP